MAVKRPCEDETPSDHQKKEGRRKQDDRKQLPPENVHAGKIEKFRVAPPKIAQEEGGNDHSKEGESGTGKSAGMLRECAEVDQAVAQIGPDEVSHGTLRDCPEQANLSSDGVWGRFQSAQFHGFFGRSGGFAIPESAGGALRPSSAIDRGVTI